MASEPISLPVAWEPSAEQERAAELFANGQRQWQVAKAVGVTLRAVQYWAAEPEFALLVNVLRAEQREKRRAKREAVIALAYDIEQEVLSGERKPDDPIALRAAAILANTEYRVYQPDVDGQPNRGTGERLSATQVNVYTGGDKPPGPA